MALSVKSYYERESNPKPEIRRLSIDQGLSTNFVIFSERLSQVYGGLKDVDLYWKGEGFLKAGHILLAYFLLSLLFLQYQYEYH